MIRDLLIMLYGVALALGLGIASAVWATNQLPLLGVMDIGGWTANPAIGGDHPDPYSQAYFSRSGGLPLAASEGLTFIRRADDAGEPFNAGCIYDIIGETPNARRWTLEILRDGFPYSIAAPGIPVGLHSRNIVRLQDGTFKIRVARRPQPGNWIYAGSSGPFALSLSLYDTSVASDTGISDLRMPKVTMAECIHG